MAAPVIKTTMLNFTLKMWNVPRLLGTINITRRFCNEVDKKSSINYLKYGNNNSIAYQRLSGEYTERSDRPGIVYCAAFQSNMHGVKANALEGYCREKNIDFVRFDYQGCGDSSGDIRECTMSDWRKDILAVLDQLTAGPQILVGDSMGALLALHTCIQRPQRVKYILGIATAADMPQRLFSNYPGNIPETVEKEGEIYYESDHHSYIITRKFLEDTKKHSLLDKDVIPINCYVRLLHGMRDDKVPYQVSVDLASKLYSRNTHVSLRKNADHRFSQPEDVMLMFEMLNCMVHGTNEVKDLAMASWDAFTMYSHPNVGDIRIGGHK